MSKITSFSGNLIEQLSKVLGEYTTGSELKKLFKQLEFPEESNGTKWRRIEFVLTQVQNRDACSNNIIKFESSL